jgi:DNA-binding SARP family transcriptional activator
MFQLKLFGAPILQGPAGPLGGRVTQRRRIALLAVLALARSGTVTRDRLLGLLWPEAEPERARPLLSDSLYLLRKALGEKAILAVGDDLRLDPQVVRCDVTEFEQALEAGQFARAVELYAGGFAEGFFVEDAPELERWIETERERLARSYARALESQAEAAAARDEWQEAVEALRRLSVHDPFSSRVALALMRALEASGDRAGAIQHARVHTLLLRRELEAEPDPEVEALATRLRREPTRRAQPGEVAVPWPSPASPRADLSEARTAVRQPEDGNPDPAPGGPEREVFTITPAGRIGSAGVARLPGGLAVLPWIRHLAVGGVLLLGLLATLTTGERGQEALALLGTGVGESLLSRGILTERERILLADFTSPTGDTLLAGMTATALRIDLAQSPVLTLIEPRQVREALSRMQRSDARTLDVELARELAVREGIKAVLVGEVTRSGRGYLISYQLLSAESGGVLTAGRQVAADSTALLPALDRLSKQLRRGIGESLRSVRADAPLERATTASLEALRKYSLALRALDAEGDDERGIALLEEAVARDTAFAMAYRRLGEVLHARGDQRARWIDAFTRAFRHRDRLTGRERYLSQASYYRHVTGEPEKAIDAIRALLDSYPDDHAALATLAVLYFHVRDWARSEEYLQRAWTVDSTSWLGLFHLITAQFNQGKFTQAQATLQRFGERFPTNRRVAQRAIEMAAARGEYARAESLALAEKQARPEDLWQQALMAVRLADLAEVQGRPEQARRHWREQSELQRRRGERDRALHSLLEIAHLDAFYRPDAVLEQVRRALELYPLSEQPVAQRPYLFLVRILAQAGDPAQARALLAEWEAAEPEGQRGQGAWVLHRALGLIALAEGRYPDAIHQFRLFQNLYRYPTYGLPDLALAYDRAAQPDSAIAVYERYLGTPDLERLFRDAFSRGPALERLGQLYEARGEPAKAAERYAEFVELWRDADPELQPRVAEARRRLAALPGRKPTAGHSEIR